MARHGHPRWLTSCGWGLIGVMTGLRMPMPVLATRSPCNMAIAAEAGDTSSVVPQHKQGRWDPSMSGND